MEFDLVFEGGGAKGMVFVGALMAFEEAGHTPGRLVGTSAGAITATLLAAGYSSEEMGEALSEKDANGEPVFAGFLDIPTADDFSESDIKNSLTINLFRGIDIPLVPGVLEEKTDLVIIKQLLALKAYPLLFSLIERGGLYVGKAFRLWLHDKIGRNNPAYSDMTLSQFHQATGKDLSLVATDTSQRSILVLNHRTAPNCPVVWAVRMSMSIPFAWHEVRWQPEWDPYICLDSTGTTVASETLLAGHTIVDGGVLSNFPIDKLTSDEPSVPRLMGDTQPNRQAVLGLLIDETLKVPNAPREPEDDEDDIAGIAGNFKKMRTVRRVTQLMNAMMQAHDKQLIEANKDLICRCPAETYGTMEFDMTDERKNALVAGGYAAMREHLANRLSQ
jgi:NTE family protein